MREVRTPLSAADGVWTAPSTFGVWGGTVEWDRRRVRRLPREEQIRVLEEQFPERLRTRMEAFQAHQDGHVPKHHAKTVRRMLTPNAVAGVERRSVRGLVPASGKV